MLYLLPVSLSVSLLQRCWVRRVLVANISTYDRLTSLLFDRAFKSSSLFAGGPEPIRRIQRVGLALGWPKQQRHMGGVVVIPPAAADDHHHRVGAAV